MIEYAARSAFASYAAGLAENADRLVKGAEDRSPWAATFLSYSSADADVLPAVIKFVENHNGRVYVDRADASLPATPNRETASTLKKRIEQCGRFLLFASDRSKDSKWMPWELGLADALKGESRVAILPAVEDVLATWPKREYLALYDKVVYGDLQGEKERVWMVLNEERNSAIELGSWLNR